MRLQRTEPLGLFELMVRPKNSTRASRTNGAKATNKGKAKKLVPVLELGHDARAGGFEVRTQGRAQLPKGYFAYESELAAQMTCVMHGRREAYEAENKDGQLPHLVDVAADEVTKLQCAEGRQGEGLGRGHKDGQAQGDHEGRKGDLRVRRGRG